MTVRCLLLMWTGDYPAQCEIAKSIFAGKHPCRRCKLEGAYTYIGSRETNGSKRERYRQTDEQLERQTDK